jgi:2-polyprenyl-3-methyl-5-hydroxy-6-metoxy-1,4-benzoquinol methylase
LADRIVSRETNKLNMENLSSCPVCGNKNFSPFLQSSDFFLTKEEFKIVRCINCGLKFVNPRPDESEIGRYYKSSDYVSHGGKMNFLTFLYKTIRNSAIRKKYKIVKQHARGKNILDIGCGTGEFLDFCNKKGFEVKGIEPAEKPRSFAQIRYKLEVKEESYLEDIVNPEFDIITMWHVLEHVHLLNERMNKIMEILKSDGTIIIAVPNCDSWDARYYGKFWAAYDLPRHLYHFSGDTMKILAQAHALKIEKIIPMKLDAFYISLLSEKYAKGNKNYFRAIINGIRSNNFAMKNDKNYSSLIFILKKENN